MRRQSKRKTPLRVPRSFALCIKRSYTSLSNFVDSGLAQRDILLGLIEQKLMAAIEGGLPTDEIQSVVEAMDEFMPDTAPDEITEALEGVVGYEFSG